MSGSRHSLFRRIFFPIALLIFVVFSLAPFAWMVLSSFVLKSQLLTDPFALPPHFTLDNYQRLFTSASEGIGSDNFFRAFRNSLVVCTLTTIISLVIGSIGGYASAVAYLTTIAMVLIILLYLWLLRSEPAA